MTSRLPYAIGALLLLYAAFAIAQESESNIPYKTVSPKKNERCIVCGVKLTEDDLALIVRGRRVPLNRTMVDSFLNNKEKYFSELQPKSALFQENLEAKEGTAQSGIELGWFLFGVYVLTALIFGGLSSYSAVSKGLPAIPNFFLGLVLHVAGFLYVLTRPAAADSGNIPTGFVKVPTTRTPTNCSECGAENHPSAKKCSACGVELQPTTESEVSRVR